MPSSLQQSSSPHFQPIFEKALKEYRKKTGKDLTAHPLAAQINGCKSPEAILTVLEPIVNELNQSQSNDQRLTKWLNPTVNILSALSATVGQGAGLVSYSAGLMTCPFPNVAFQVFPPATIICSGIAILLVVSLPAQSSAYVTRTSSLQVAKSTMSNRDVLVNIFQKIESFFERLKIYTKVPPSLALTDELAKIMAEVLSILAIATKGIKAGRISGSIFCDKPLLA
jgi:hypothetical protein